MADTRKVTITLPVATLDAVRRLVDAGAAPRCLGSCSTPWAWPSTTWAGWAAALSEALADSGGELSARERAWADDVLAHRRPAGAA